jgi:hypothetical protein
VVAAPSEGRVPALKAPSVNEGSVPALKVPSVKEGATAAVSTPVTKSASVVPLKETALAALVPAAVTEPVAVSS